MPYSLILENSFWAALLFSPAHDWVMDAVLGFSALRGYAVDPAMLAAIGGSTAASMVNFALGRAALRLRRLNIFARGDNNLSQAEPYWQRWGLWLLLFPALAFHEVFFFLSGLLRSRAWLVLLLAVTGRTVYYLYNAWRILA